MADATKGADADCNDGKVGCSKESDAKAIENGEPSPRNHLGLDKGASSSDGGVDGPYTDLPRRHANNQRHWPGHRYMGYSFSDSPTYYHQPPLRRSNPGYTGVDHRPHNDYHPAAYRHRSSQYYGNPGYTGAESRYHTNYYYPAHLDESSTGHDNPAYVNVDNRRRNNHYSWEGYKRPRYTRLSHPYQPAVYRRGMYDEPTPGHGPEKLFTNSCHAQKSGSPLPCGKSVLRPEAPEFVPTKVAGDATFEYEWPTQRYGVDDLQDI